MGTIGIGHGGDVSSITSLKHTATTVATKLEGKADTLAHATLLIREGIVQTFKESLSQHKWVAVGHDTEGKILFAHVSEVAKQLGISTQQVRQDAKQGVLEAKVNQSELSLVKGTSERLNYHTNRVSRYVESNWEALVQEVKGSEGGVITKTVLGQTVQVKKISENEFQVLYSKQRLGAGGIKVASRWKDFATGTSIAGQVLQNQSKLSDAVIKDIEKTMERAKRCEGRGVIRIFTTTFEGKVGAMAEFCSGGSLDQIANPSKMQKFLSLFKKPLDKTEMFNITYDLVCGLKRVHEEGVIHGDISPDNLFLREPRKNAVIADFDIARDKGEPFVLAGKPAYFSPEGVTVLRNLELASKDRSNQIDTIKDELSKSTTRAELSKMRTLVQEQLLSPESIIITLNNETFQKLYDGYIFDLSKPEDSKKLMDGFNQEFVIDGKIDLEKFTQACDPLFLQERKADILDEYRKNLSKLSWLDAVIVREFIIASNLSADTVNDSDIATIRNALISDRKFNEQLEIATKTYVNASVAAPHDVWALGCSLYQIYYQKDPGCLKLADTAIQGNSYVDRKLSSDNLQKWKPEVPPGVSPDDPMFKLISSMLVVDPKQRITMEQALARLDEINPQNT